MTTELERQVADLTKEVRYLRDRREIEDCIHRYSRGLDRLDRELALSAYHHDADCTDDRGINVGTPEEFVDWVWGVLKGVEGTAHSISNISVEIDGDVAHAESYINFHVWADNSNRLFMGNARYLDKLERRGGRWGIVHREALIDYRAKLESIGLAGELMGTRDKQDRSYERPLSLSEDGVKRRAEKQAVPAE